VLSKLSRTYDPEAEYIDVQPAGLERLELGIFATEESIPEYQFSCVPDLPDAIQINLTKTETKEGIIAMYHIQNYCMETVRVFPTKVIAEE